MRRRFLLQLRALGRDPGADLAAQAAEREDLVRQRGIRLPNKVLLCLSDLLAAHPPASPEGAS